MANVFVTGSNGFIGSHLIAYLLARGDRVTGLVRHGSDLRSLSPLFEAYPDQLRLVVGDLRDPDSLGAGLADAELIFHLGAVLLGTSEEEFRETNVDGTRNLLEAVQRLSNGRLRRLVYTSSLAAAGPAPTPAPIDETVSPHPVSWYGQTKLGGEDQVRRVSQQGLPTTIVRLAPVYGEREYLLARPTFPVVRMGIMPQIGVPDPVLSFVYVGDVVRGIVAAAESAATVGNLYFLADPRPYPSREVLTAIADGFGSRLRIPIVVPSQSLLVLGPIAEWIHLMTGEKPLATRDKAREGQYPYWTCSPELARQTFGWQSEVSLEKGMAQTVRYWLEEQAIADRAADAESFSDRATKTMSVSILAGLIEAAIDLPFGGIDLSGLARALGMRASSWWLSFVAIVSVFGVLMGAIALWTSRLSTLQQFLGGAVIGAGLELANQLRLHWWTWSPSTFGRLRGPWLPALVLGLPAGLYPILINRIVRMLYHGKPPFPPDRALP